MSGTRRDEKGRFASNREGGAPARPAAKAKGGRARRKAKTWNRRTRAIFFRELAIVCNVSAALRAAGLKDSRKLYERRKADPSFGAQWDSAVAESYRYLELEMLERSRFGDSRPEPETEVEKKLRQVPASLAIQLLKLHQATARGRAAAAPAPRPDRAEGRRLRAEIEARLVQISRRLGGAG